MDKKYIPQEKKNSKFKTTNKFNLLILKWSNF